MEGKKALELLCEQNSHLPWAFLILMRKPTTKATSASSLAALNCTFSGLLAVHSTCLSAVGFIQCPIYQPDSELINFTEAGGHGNGQEFTQEFQQEFSYLDS